jgi:predicted ABC-type transport system involved in lysophospholipase L1 biosynthesis ATPase subunit
MDWEPNVDGVEYFCSQIWPKVLAQVSGAQFRIVGRNPDKRVRKWASDTVQVTGRVASVVDHLRDATAVIVPLRIGGGTRLKIYEAMATGRAVVSTTIGAEGLDVHHGEDVLLADEPTGNLDDAYARDIVDLFTSFHQVGVTVAIATHDRLVAQQLSARTIHLGQGRVTG